MHEVAPTAASLCPGGHLEQTVAPGAGEKVPGRHWPHVLAPSIGANLPREEKGEFPCHKALTRRRI